MRIRIIRHGEVDYDWGRKLDSKEYDRSCSEYDTSPIKDREKTSGVGLECSRKGAVAVSLRQTAGDKEDVPAKSKSSDCRAGRSGDRLQFGLP